MSDEDLRRIFTRIDDVLDSLRKSDLRIGLGESAIESLRADVAKLKTSVFEGHGAEDSIKASVKTISRDIGEIQDNLDRMKGSEYTRHKEDKQFRRSIFLTMLAAVTAATISILLSYFGI